MGPLVVVESERRFIYSGGAAVLVFWELITVNSSVLILTDLTSCCDNVSVFSVTKRHPDKEDVVLTV